MKSVFAFRNEEAIGPIPLQTSLFSWNDDNVLTRDGQPLRMSHDRITRGAGRAEAQAGGAAKQMKTAIATIVLSLAAVTAPAETARDTYIQKYGNITRTSEPIDWRHFNR